jgi:hypothetical protein
MGRLGIELLGICLFFKLLAFLYVAFGLDVRFLGDGEIMGFSYLGYNLIFEGML